MYFLCDIWDIITKYLIEYPDFSQMKYKLPKNYKHKIQLENKPGTIHRIYYDNKYKRMARSSKLQFKIQNITKKIPLLFTEFSTNIPIESLEYIYFKMKNRNIVIYKDVIIPEMFDIMYCYYGLPRVNHNNSTIIPYIWSKSGIEQPHMNYEKYSIVFVFKEILDMECENFYLEYKTSRIADGYLGNIYPLIKCDMVLESVKSLPINSNIPFILVKTRNKCLSILIDDNKTIKRFILYRKITRNNYSLFEFMPLYDSVYSVYINGTIHFEEKHTIILSRLVLLFYA